MKNVAFILLLLLPLLVFGQQKDLKRSNWSVSFVYSPDSYAPPQVENDAGTYQKLAYRVGVDLIKPFNENPRTSFRTGLRRAVYNTRIEAFGVVSGSPLDIISFEKLTYYEVPFALRYTFGNQQLRFYTEAMCSMNFGGSNSSLKPHISWGLSAGLDCQITNSLSIFAQPILRKPLVRNYTYFFCVGVEMGVKMKL